MFKGFNEKNTTECLTKVKIHRPLTLTITLRIDNSGWSVNCSALFDVAGMRLYKSKYHVLYTIRQPIINSIYWYIQW